MSLPAERHSDGGHAHVMQRCWHVHLIHDAAANIVAKARRVLQRHAVTRALRHAERVAAVQLHHALHLPERYVVAGLEAMVVFVRDHVAGSALWARRVPAGGLCAIFAKIARSAPRTLLMDSTTAERGCSPVGSSTLCCGPKSENAYPARPHTSAAMNATGGAKVRQCSFKCTS